jgi:hypothetical protein
MMELISSLIRTTTITLDGEMIQTPPVWSSGGSLAMNDHDKMLIEWTCEKIVKQFVQYLDANQLDQLGELFTEDASYARPVDPSNVLVGRTAIVDALKRRPPRITRHLMTNVVIEVISEYEAHGVSYCSFTGSTNVNGAAPVMADPKLFLAEFRDTFVRTNSGWKIKSRVGSLPMIFQATP